MPCIFQNWRGLILGLQMANIKYTTVRDPKWADETKTQILCMVQFDHIAEEVPFTADLRDVEPHGREIFKRAISGEFGPVGMAKREDFSRIEIFSGDHPLRLYLHEANKENQSGTDRGVVLVWASIIDEILQKILDAFTADVPDKVNSLFGNQAPFGTFSNRAKTALALGLITEDEADSINLVRKIRNDFAHQIDVDLSDKGLTSKCDELSMRMVGEKYPEQPRLAFTSGCCRIMVVLDHRLAAASSQNVKILSDETPLHKRFM